MSSNVINQQAFLRSSREFTDDIHQLTVDVNKAYVETANAVNVRTISLFPVNRPAQTGEGWFLQKNQKQSGFRQVYTFTSTASITHGINVKNISQFIRCWGTFTDTTNKSSQNWYGLIFGSNVAIAGQITFYVTQTQIVFLSGAGVPTLAAGTIVLEWISEP